MSSTTKYIIDQDIVNNLDGLLDYLSKLRMLWISMGIDSPEITKWVSALEDLDEIFHYDSR